MLNLKKLQKEEGKKNETYQPDDKAKKALKEFYNCFHQGSNFRTHYEDQWQENLDRYEAYPFYHEDGSAGVNLPIAKWMVEQKQSVEMKAPPTFNYEPKEYEEDKQVAKLLDTVVKKHVWNLKYVSMDSNLSVMSHYKDVFGDMYQFIGWKKIFRNIEGKSKLFYDDVYVKNYMPFDVWLHPLSNGCHDSPWIIVRDRFSYDSFLESFSDDEMFKDVDKVKKGSWDMGSDRIFTQKKDFYEKGSEVMVFQYWNCMRDKLLIVANGVVIFDGYNPYEHKELPFWNMKNRLQIDTYVGEGEPQRIASIADSINAFINIGIDKEKRAGAGLNLLDSNLSDFDDVSELFSPREVARVSNPRDAFVHYELPGMNSSTSNVINMLMDYLIFATGVDFRQIADMNTSTTATVAAIRREISQGRLNLNLKRNESQGFARMGWLLMKVVQQYYPIPLIDHIAGDESLSPEERKKILEKGKLKYRKIRVKGQRITEEPDSQGNYTMRSLKREKSDNPKAIGFFEARPGYIRSKGDLCVQVISESTFSASKELQKSKAKEYMETVSSLFVTTPEGQQKPLGSLEYGFEKYVEAMGYDKDKAMDLEKDGEEDKTAKNMMEKMLPPEMMGGEPQGEQPVMPDMRRQLPENAGPPPLTGKGSEPVKKANAELGAANDVTR